MEVNSSRPSAYRGYLLFSKSISDNDVEIGVKWSGRPNLATLAPANKKLSNSGSQLSLTHWKPMDATANSNLSDGFN
jgi:hypothetical protein